VVAVAGQPFAHGQTPTPAANVTASNYVFTDKDVTIDQGQTVQWTRSEGFHDVRFDDNTELPPAGPSSNWATVTRTFDTPGTYHYVCSVHFATHQMEGTVTVRPAASPAPTPIPPPAATPPPTGAGPAPARLLGVKLLRTHFCTKRSRTCKKPGVVLSIDLSGTAAVTGTLSRARLHGAARYKRFGRVDFGRVGAGKHQLRFDRTKSGRKLTPARYELRLVAAGTTRTLRFRIRPS